MKTWTLLVALAQKMQAQRGLSDPGRPGKEGCAVARKTAARHMVKLFETNPDRRADRRGRRGNPEHCLGPRVDRQSPVRNLIRMLAGQKPGPAHLLYFQMAFRASPIQLRLELNNAIDHRVSDGNRGHLCAAKKKY